MLKLLKILKNSVTLEQITFCPKRKFEISNQIKFEHFLSKLGNTGLLPLVNLTVLYLNYCTTKK